MHFLTPQQIAWRAGFCMLVLAGILVYITTTHIKHPYSVAQTTVADALPTYTSTTLHAFNGDDPTLPIYIAFEGNVYDVTAGRSFYEPGASYHFLAGTDGTSVLQYIGGDIIKRKYPVVGTFTE